MLFYYSFINLFFLIHSVTLFLTFGINNREYFEDVDRTWETFEKTLWEHVSNFYKLSKERYIVNSFNDIIKFNVVSYYLNF